jgi:acetamidase/formamidase
LTIAPGESVEFEVKDASNGHLSPEASAPDLLTLDLASVNPVTGPIEIDGAASGDALKVTFLDLAPSGWG